MAGYLAWRTVRSSDNTDLAIPEDEATKTKSEEERREFDSAEGKFPYKFQMIQNGFWVFVDMASGKYLWRNIKSLNNVEKTN